MTKGVAMANKKLVDLLLQDENAKVFNEEFDTLSGSDWVCLLLKKPSLLINAIVAKYLMPLFREQR